ncbi:MAG: hypothetical protein K2I47_00485 [Odoribacter sp.]|nr:hypothetical protein [Odoribacter sp.]
MRYTKIIAIILAILVTGCKEPKKTENFRYFRNYSRTFNDMNDKHLKAARQWGIKPVTSAGELKKLKGKVVQLKSCRWYELDKLTHSQPYLVPKAHNLLKNIGRNFKDSLDAKGLPSYKIVVTSVLRTNESIMKLRKKNLNASVNSAHMFGTTFDIAYARFRQEDSDGTSVEKLKSVLADVLHDLQRKKSCYVRYEFKQGCFHITVR